MLFPLEVLLYRSPSLPSVSKRVLPHLHIHAHLTPVISPFSGAIKPAQVQEHLSPLRPEKAIYVLRAMDQPMYVCCLIHGLLSGIPEVHLVESVGFSYEVAIPFSFFNPFPNFSMWFLSSVQMVGYKYLHWC